MQSSPFCAAVLCAAGIMMTACNADISPSVRRPVPTQPSPSPRAPQPPAPRPDPVVREIRLGEAVEENIEFDDPSCTFSEDSLRPIGFIGSKPPCRHFQVVAPADGALVVTVAWDDELPGVTLLLKIEETEFSPRDPRGSPVRGRAKITAGQRYRVTVGAVGYDIWGGRFALTTEME